MSSWFSGLTETVQTVQNTVAEVNFQELTDTVQNALPTIDSEMIGKLTLTTPELSAERQRIDQEEKRKEQVRDALAGLLPWETRDPDRDILVDECRQAILKLTEDKSTFFGPYEMPEKVVNLEEEKEGESDENEEEEEEEEEEPAQPEASSSNKPPAESLEKLSKLEPLPVLLREFDLNSHVGLINRLLKEDPKLVEMQSTLSGGGKREQVFWCNYFFHCAYTRYEAGLSLDEIWSDNPPVFEAAIQETEEEDNAEETITFDGEPSDSAFPTEPATSPDAPFTKDTEAASSATNDSPATDFEMVTDEGAGTGSEIELDAGDYELDELEAEIAKELEN